MRKHPGIYHSTVCAILTFQELGFWAPLMVFDKDGFQREFEQLIRDFPRVRTEVFKAHTAKDENGDENTIHGASTTDILRFLLVINDEDPKGVIINTSPEETFHRSMALLRRACGTELDKTEQGLVKHLDLRKTDWKAFKEKERRSFPFQIYSSSEPDDPTFQDEEAFPTWETQMEAMRARRFHDDGTPNESWEVCDG